MVGPRCLRKSRALTLDRAEDEPLLVPVFGATALLCRARRPPLLPELDDELEEAFRAGAAQWAMAKPNSLRMSCTTKRACSSDEKDRGGGGTDDEALSASRSRRASSSISS